MPQNDDPVVPPPPDDDREDVEAAEPGEVASEDPTRRLLLYEVLLEEYETHRPPDGQPGVGDLKKVQQPRLHDKGLRAIRRKGKKKRAIAEMIKREKGQQASIEFENKYNGELVSQFFTLLTRKQQDAAAETFESLIRKHSDNHEGKMAEINRVGGISTPDADVVVGRAAIAELYGILDDYREQHRKDRAEEADEEEAGETEESKETEESRERKRSSEKWKNLDPEVAAYKALIEELNREKEAADKAREKEARLRRGGSGNGNGTSPGGPLKKYDSASDAKYAYGRTLRSALCLSGGGIRSATFNLGIIQGLARHGLLEQFDYLSTVSGGGFIGGWLSAWIHREGETARVARELSQPPQSPIQPEPRPLKHLRVFSNYLSPQVGLLSADTWTLVSTLLRNLLLIWLVFIPFLLVILALPRVWLSTIMSLPLRVTNLPGWRLVINTLGASLPDARRVIDTLHISSLDWRLAIGVLGTWWALAYAGVTLSRQEEDPPRDLSPYKNREKPFFLNCLLPGVISVAAFALYWWALTAPTPGADDQQHHQWGKYHWGDFVKVSLLLLAVPWIISALFRFVQALFEHQTNRTPQAHANYLNIRRRLVVATLLIVVAQLATGALLYVVATKIFPAVAAPPLYAAFSVPLLLLVLGVDCALIVGFTSSLAKDKDLEWWGRAGAWLLIVIFAWAATHLLVLLGPSILLLLGVTLRQASQTSFWDANTLKLAGQVLTVVGGVVSGVITLAGGFSGKTDARGVKQGGAGLGGKLLGLLSSLLAPLFLAFIILVLALGTSWLLISPFAVWLNEVWNYVTPPAFQSVLTTEFLDSFAKLDHATLVTQTPLPLLFIIVLFFSAVCSLMGILINSNRFSLHYMWRDRIIRAYLGASRPPGRRRPNQFTGFDTDDNLYMYKLREQPAAVREAVRRGEVERGVVAPEQVAAEEAEVIEGDGEKDPLGRRKLFHVLNLALNLAGGDNLAWQDRKAESLTVSPLHAGSYWLGYRRSFVYGGSDDGGISLGTAVAISGAFVSPNMGYMMSSPVVRFLMTLFNVRFGWWLGNPGAGGDEEEFTGRAIARLQRFFGGGSGKPFEIRAPRHPIRPIIEEAFGKTNDAAPYVYLSDGGHFENLGLYEMVLRRCRFIVVSDASTDAGYSFDSLAQSIRQIRVDLGVPIELKEMSIASPAQDLRGKYCAVGKIRYSCVDRKSPKENPAHAELKDADFDGTLVYIKASMIGEEPRDVINYGQGSAAFPQEIIVDQWFTEAQFESYRALGSHIIDAICSGDQREIGDQGKLSLVAFERKVREHNQINFRAFNERVNYAALTSQFRRELARNAPPRFEQRVSDYVKDLLG